MDGLHFNSNALHPDVRTTQRSNQSNHSTTTTPRQISHSQTNIRKDTSLRTKIHIRSNNRMRHLADTRMTARQMPWLSSARWRNLKQSTTAEPVADLSCPHLNAAHGVQSAGRRKSHGRMRTQLSTTHPVSSARMRPGIHQHLLRMMRSQRRIRLRQNRWHISARIIRTRQIRPEIHPRQQPMIHIRLQRNRRCPFSTQRKIRIG